MELLLPWPKPELSPNSRAHWSVKNRAAQKLKNECWAITKQSMLKGKPGKFYYLAITFRPPQNRRQDLDNMLSRAKYALDGVALGMGIDDSKFKLGLELGDSVRGGAIIVKISEMVE